MIFADALTFNNPRRTRDGYLAVRAKAARSGVYQYAGREVDPGNVHGLRDQAVVHVYRPEAEVFARDSVASFLMKPVTDDHPIEPVTATNWKEYGRGVIANALRDGEHLAFDLVIMDEAAIAAVDKGKRALSNGYACDLIFEEGTAPDGTLYQAVQTNIRGNHIALVDHARGGADCRIADSIAICDAIAAPFMDLKGEKPVMEQKAPEAASKAASKTEPKMKAEPETESETETETESETETVTKTVKTKTITFNGAPLDITDDGEAALNLLAAKLADAQNFDLDKMVAERADLIIKAKGLKADIVTDGKSNTAIQLEIVSAHIGSAAKDFNAAQIAAAFTVIAQDTKPTDPVQAVVNGGTIRVGDAATREQAALNEANDFNGWRSVSAA